MTFFRIDDQVLFCVKRFGFEFNRFVPKILSPSENPTLL